MVKSQLILYLLCPFLQVDGKGESSIVTQQSFQCHQVWELIHIDDSFANLSPQKGVVQLSNQGWNLSLGLLES